jgi:hypothetical protein
MDWENIVIIHVYTVKHKKNYFKGFFVSKFHFAKGQFTNWTNTGENSLK